MDSQPLSSTGTAEPSQDRIGGLGWGRSCCPGSAAPPPGLEEKIKLGKGEKERMVMGQTKSSSNQSRWNSKKDKAGSPALKPGLFALRLCKVGWQGDTGRTSPWPAGNRSARMSNWMDQSRQGQTVMPARAVACHTGPSHNAVKAVHATLLACHLAAKLQRLQRALSCRWNEELGPRLASWAGSAAAPPLPHTLLPTL